MNYHIKYTRGHYEVSDAQGKFLFSADTEREAQAELTEWEIT